MDTISILQISYPVDITVQQRYTTDTGEVIVEDCNHAGAEPQHFYSEHYSWNDDSLRTEVTTALECDKCTAVYNDVEESWEV